MIYLIVTTTSMAFSGRNRPAIIPTRMPRSNRAGRLFKSFILLSFLFLATFYRVVVGYILIKTGFALFICAVFAVWLYIASIIAQQCASARRSAALFRRHDLE
jgi:hypothetical protein